MLTYSQQSRDLSAHLAYFSRGNYKATLAYRQEANLKRLGEFIIETWKYILYIIYYINI